MADNKPTNTKDRALIAQVAGGVAAGLAAQNFFHNGRNVNEGLVAKASVRIARLILDEIDVPTVVEAKP